jgi:hypothetical protein
MVIEIANCFKNLNVLTHKLSRYYEKNLAKKKVF